MESLKTRILISFLVIIATLFIFNVVFFVAHFTMIGKYKAIANNMIAEYQIIILSANFTKNCEARIKDVASSEKLNGYNQTLYAIAALFSELDQAIIDENSRAAYQELGKTVNNLIAGCGGGIAAILEKDLLNQGGYLTSINRQNSLVREKTIDLILKELEYTQKLQINIDRTQLVITIGGGLMWLIMIIGCILYAFGFSKKLISPLLSLTQLAKKIESGDLNATVDQKLLHVFQSRGDLLQGNDEIASLANSFNTMLFSLRSNIEKLQEYNAKLIKARQQVASGELEISQLKELDRMKNEIMNIATHELKTPLVSIVGLSEVMLQTGKTLPAEYQKYISVIHEEGSKLSNLIKKMLKSVKNESGRVELVKTKFNLSDLIASLETPLNTIAKRSESKVVIKITAQNIKLESDQEKISQVIYNFVDNAVKYGPKQQTIQVVLTQPDAKFVKVEVVGAGAGIPKERQKKLFLKFSQLEPSLTRSQDGMGLGLYICKQSVEMLGGQIGVVSEPGQGATFYFTLPIN